MIEVTMENIRKVVFDPLLTPFTEAEQTELRKLRDDRKFFIRYQQLLKKYRVPTKS